jgi:hypothetical protein
MIRGRRPPIGVARDHMARVMSIQGSIEEELDSWLATPSLRVSHRQRSSASPDTLWHAAVGLRLDQSPALGRLIQWRIPGTHGDQPFEQLFREPPFLVLAERPQRALVSGLVGRIWTLRRDYPKLQIPQEFRDWSQRGTARVVIANWVTEEPDGGGALWAEARVQALGTQGHIGVAAVRPLVRAFEHLLGTETLGAAVRAAESGG